jgi:hypothetical protein
MQHHDGIKLHCLVTSYAFKYLGLFLVRHFEKSQIIKSGFFY